MSNLNQLQLDKADNLLLYVANNYRLYVRVFNTMQGYFFEELPAKNMKYRVREMVRAARSYSDYNNIGAGSVEHATQELIAEYIEEYQQGNIKKGLMI